MRFDAPSNIEGKPSAAIAAEWLMMLETSLASATGR
jgi:hypothetical protein